jgi:folate-dependent phosphoribosylglycinamide formyltransferase PurN
MGLRPIHDPTTGPLKLIALMSGSGTNVRRILESRDRLREAEGRSPFEVAAIFSDCWDSRATVIGRDFGLPVVTHDLNAWLQRSGVDRKDLARREEFDRQTVAMLRPFGAAAAIYGGYMAIASPTLVNAFLGVNVHPADLSVLTAEGKRRFVGAHAVADAIAAGERVLHATTHLVTLEVDAGPLLMISAPVAVEIPPGADLARPEVLAQVAEANQERLKATGDWVIFPRTIEEIARGYFARDDAGAISYRGRAIPGGMRL